MENSNPPVTRKMRHKTVSLVSIAPGIHHITNDHHDEETGKFGDKLADRLTSFGGSWWFIGIFLTSLVAWVIINVCLLKAKAFDPYPFILLNLFLSMLASIQAPVILMSQNRQATKDRIHAHQDHETNLKAELEIERLHQKIDEVLATLEELKRR